jgi:beta-lactamase regulating signal transducer with metallopeptidase domain
MTQLWWRAFVALSLSGGAFCFALAGAFALQKLVGRRVIAARAWVVAGRWALVLALFSVSVPRGSALRSLGPQQAVASTALAKVNQQIATIGKSAAKVEKVGASSVPLAKGFCFAAIAGAFLQLGFSLLGLVRRQRSWRVLHRFKRASVRIDDDAIAPFAYRVSRTAEVVMPRTLASRAALLRHEFAHHRHGDTAWALPLALLRALFILNPMMHAWLWCLRQLEEIAADEAAARGASLVYAKTYRLACPPAFTLHKPRSKGEFVSCACHKAIASYKSPFFHFLSCSSLGAWPLLACRRLFLGRCRARK